MGDVSCLRGVRVVRDTGDIGDLGCVGCMRCEHGAYHVCTRCFLQLIAQRRGGTRKGGLSGGNKKQVGQSIREGKIVFRQYPNPNLTRTFLKQPKP